MSFTIVCQECLNELALCVCDDEVEQTDEGQIHEARIYEGEESNLEYL